MSTKKKIELGRSTTTSNIHTEHTSETGDSLDKIYLDAERLGYQPSEVQTETIQGETDDQYGGMYNYFERVYFVYEEIKKET